MQSATLTAVTFNAIFNYLCSRPFGEVEQLIASIRREVDPQIAAASAAKQEPSAPDA